MGLKNRVARLEAGRESRDHCQLCELILRAGGMPPSEAAALARHPRHTLEEIVLASMERHREAVAPPLPEPRY